MTLQIHAVSEIDSSDLRSLVVDNLGALLGTGARLVENMPQMNGCCLATSDTHDGPVLLSFDAVDPQRALITGLTWMDQLSGEMVPLFLQEFHPPTGLVVLAPAAPPGLTLFSGSCPVNWQRIQVLSVNGEFGMLIERAVEETTSVEPTPQESHPTIIESVLSTEEKQHFSQL